MNQTPKRTPAQSVAPKMNVAAAPPVPAAPATPSVPMGAQPSPIPAQAVPAAEKEQGVVESQAALLRTMAVSRDDIRSAMAKKEPSKWDVLKEARRAAKAARDAEAEMQERMYRAEDGTELERRLRRDRVFFNNPVMMQGLGLAPLIVAATTTKNAWMLCVAVLLLLMPTRLLASVVSRVTPYRFRGLAYALCAGVVYLGVYWCMNKLFIGADLALLGLYLPLLVVDPIVLKRYERAQNEKPITAVRKGLITTFGYILVLLLVGGLREVLASGTLSGVKLLSFAPLPIAALPMGGFAVLAIVMVLWRGLAWVIRQSLDPEQEEKA